jgi:hypothetical protein
MDEEETFKTLKRIPYDEMMKKWDEYAVPIPPVFKIGAICFERQIHYPQTTFLYEKTKVMEENGWTLEDFAYESEKRAVKMYIDEINKQLSSTSPEIMDHARKFFPNLEFIPASIKLE